MTMEWKPKENMIEMRNVLELSWQDAGFVCGSWHLKKFSRFRITRPRLYLSLCFIILRCEAIPEHFSRAMLSFTIYL